MAPPRSIVEAFEIRPGMKIGLVNEPDDFNTLLGTLPPGAVLLTRASEPLDLLIYFSDELANIKTRLPYLARFVPDHAPIWMVHPRAGLTDSEEGTAAVVKAGMDGGLSAESTEVLNDQWTAVRFKTSS